MESAVYHRLLSPAGGSGLTTALVMPDAGVIDWVSYNGRITVGTGTGSFITSVLGAVNNTTPVLSSDSDNRDFSIFYHSIDVNTANANVVNSFQWFQGPNLNVPFPRGGSVAFRVTAATGNVTCEIIFKVTFL